MDLISLYVKVIRVYYKEKGVRSGSVSKHVVCEHCHAHYVYHMERSAGAIGFHLPQNISYLAHRALRRKLKRDCDLVPCPACGWYQEVMNRKSRKAASREMPVASIILTLASAPLFILSLWVWDHGPNPTHDRQSMVIALAIAVAGVLCLLIGLGLAVAKYLRASHIDLNAASQEERLRIGRARAMVIDESQFPES